MNRVRYQYAIPVIILDCEKKSQAGIIHTFGRKGVPIIAVSCRRDCPAFHSRYITETILSPNLSLDEKKYIDFLCNLKRKGVLIYSADESAVAVSRNQERLRSAGFLLNIPELGTQESVFDKWACYQTADSLSIPMAKSKLVNSTQDIIDIWDQFQKPVILKGTRLAGGVHYMINKKDEIEEKYAELCKTIDSDFFRARKSEIMIQEWMEYGMTDMWSCETVYDKKSQPMGFFSIQRIRSSLNDEGLYTSYLFAGEHVRSDELEKTTEKILNHIGWKGFAHVEYFFVPEEQKFYLTEINPRLPGYSYYPSQAGFDMAYYYYMDLIGKPVDLPQSYPESVFFSALMHPGDISGGLVHIAKGNLKLLPFLRSYFKLLKRNCVKVIDPIRFDDPSFTLSYIINEIAPPLKKKFDFRKWKMNLRKKLS